MTNNSQDDYNLFPRGSKKKLDLFPEDTATKDDLFPAHDSSEGDLYPHQSTTEEEIEAVRRFADVKDLNPVDTQRLLSIYRHIEAKRKRLTEKDKDSLW